MNLKVPSRLHGLPDVHLYNYGNLVYQSQNTFSNHGHKILSLHGDLPVNQEGEKGKDYFILI
jgi:hypothetical protein